MTPTLAAAISAASITLAERLAAIGTAPPAAAAKARTAYHRAVDGAKAGLLPIPGTYAYAEPQPGQPRAVIYLSDARAGKPTRATITITLAPNARTNILAEVPCPSTPDEVLSIWHAAIDKTSAMLTAAHTHNLAALDALRVTT